VVLWIHGGGWKQGSKEGVQKKPQAFADKGFVFVSTNHRFIPKLYFPEVSNSQAAVWIRRWHSSFNFSC